MPSNHGYLTLYRKNGGTDTSIEEINDVLHPTNTTAGWYASFVYDASGYTKAALQSTNHPYSMMGFKNGTIVKNIDYATYSSPIDISGCDMIIFNTYSGSNVNWKLTLS